MRSEAQCYVHSLKSFNTNCKDTYKCIKPIRMPAYWRKKGMGMGMGIRPGDKNAHIHTYRLMRRVCRKLKSKTNSTLCASASINVFICLSRKLLSSVMIHVPAIDFVIFFSIRFLHIFWHFGRQAHFFFFNEIYFVSFSCSLSLCAYPSLADRPVRPPAQK